MISVTLLAFVQLITNTSMSHLCQNTGGVGAKWSYWEAGRCITRNSDQDYVAVNKNGWMKNMFSVDSLGVKYSLTAE